ncbi:DUF58 domain-containing protein [Parafilimonas sp.]|uniref:DUF58 domain-containing protein n=1 Tax=Parafilimonas sp. TaxID=1969739 RepID=UPI0039E374E3
MLKRIFYRLRFYFTGLFYTIGSVIVALFILAFFAGPLQQIATIALLCLCLTVILDFIIVFAGSKPVTAKRFCAERFSNGDENKVTIELTNRRAYKVAVEVIDELPVQFQQRNWKRNFGMKEHEVLSFDYYLKPTERGEYFFGIINIFLRGPLNMVIRHITGGEEQKVAVYPSFMQMKKYQLMAVTSQLRQGGSRRLRKLGSSLEFEQIKEYVQGDDYRRINWKATARKSGLMVNNYMDERSQQVVCLIDKGRSMKMPFEGMTLLDYAINATLVLSNIVLLKQDKSGLLTFDKKTDQFIQPDKKPAQINLILQTLYRQQTDFMDSDFEALYVHTRYHLKQRSLLILFTNFESLYSMERQLPYLKQLSTHHPLLVIFFENTELAALQQTKAQTVEGVYHQTIANKFAFEKRQIVKELQKHGIMSLLTAPQKLTANTINKYLELKERQVV